MHRFLLAALLVFAWGVGPGWGAEPGRLKEGHAWRALPAAGVGRLGAALHAAPARGPAGDARPLPELLVNQRRSFTAIGPSTGRARRRRCAG